MKFKFRVLLRIDDNLCVQMAAKKAESYANLLEIQTLIKQNIRQTDEHKICKISVEERNWETSEKRDETMRHKTVWFNENFQHEMRDWEREWKWAVFASSLSA